ncbi:MAG: methylated-DNA--[protein]-cysteine S-methyltransferase [Acidobacteria bacterium]|nr:methylated-DNA--[protein]-cysteine S-methyltransferase [Acidobacteriota bacterium]
MDHLSRLARSLMVAAPKTRLRAGGMADSFDCLDTMTPAAWVAFSDRGIRMIHPGGSEDEFRSRYAKRFGRILVRGSLPRVLRGRVLGALSGKGAGRARVDFGEATQLEQQVLRTLGRIPRGEVRTYAWLAQQIGRPTAVRAVANVVARNFVPFVVPCHRVVPASGGLGEYGFGAAMKRELLQREGVDVDRLERLARQHVRFIGSRTTRIVCFPTCGAALRIREENRVPFHGAEEAVQEGFRPCRRCRPFAA